MKGTDQSTYPGNWKVQNRSSGPWHCSLLPGLCTDGHWRLFLFQSEGHILSLSLASANSFCLLVYSLSIFFFSFLKHWILFSFVPGTVFFVLLAALCGTWDLSYPTRDQTCSPCSGSGESSPLDQQGSPFTQYFNKHCLSGRKEDLNF